MHLQIKIEFSLSENLLGSDFKFVGQMLRFMGHMLFFVGNVLHSVGQNVMGQMLYILWVTFSEKSCGPFCYVLWVEMYLYPPVLTTFESKRVRFLVFELF